MTLVLVHGYALNLDCWHFQRVHFRGQLRQVLLRPAFPRPIQPLRRRSCAGFPSWPRICIQVLDEVVGDGPVVLVGHSMGGMTIMRLAQVHPELFGTRILGVALFSTSAGEMADYSPIRGIPGRTFSRIAEPLMAALNRIPELVCRARGGQRSGLRRHPADGLRLGRPVQLCRVRDADARRDPAGGGGRLLPGVRGVGRVRGLESLRRSRRP